MLIFSNNFISFSKARRLKAESREQGGDGRGAGEDAGQGHDPVPVHPR